MRFLKQLPQWLLRSAFICFLLQALTGALLTLHYEPSLRPAMTESGKPIIMLETTKAFRHKPTQTRYYAHELLFAEYDTAAKAPFYAPDTLRFLTRILTHSPSNVPILPNAAYYSVEHGVMRSADFGAQVRGVHAAAANLAVIILTLWLGICLLAGTYAQIHHYHWLCGVVLFALTFGTSILGYILPMNLRSFVALNILLSTLESTPLLGKWLAGIVRGASSLSSLTLVRVYALHILFVPIVLAVCWYALGKTSIFRGQTDREGKEWVQTALLGVGIVWLCVMASCCIVPSSLDAVRLPADMTTVVATSHKTQPEWYALGIAALLRMLPAWSIIAGIVVWLSLAVLQPVIARFSALSAIIIRGLCSAALLGLCALTVWELQWYTFPTLALTEENLEVVVVMSVLNATLGGVLAAGLREQGAEIQKRIV